MNDETNGHDPNAPHGVRAVIAPPSTPADVAAQLHAARVATYRAQLHANTWQASGDKLRDRVMRRAQGVERPIPTPWPTVNERMGGGLWPGFHVLVGGTGSGKSQWAMQAVMGAAMQGIPSLVLSLELDALGVYARAASMVNDARHPDDAVRVPWSHLYTGGYHASDSVRGERVENITRALDDDLAAALAALPVWWCAAPPHGMPYADLDAVVAAFREEARERLPLYDGPVLVVLDFLQLVAGEPREDNVSRVSKTAYRCRAIARGERDESDVAVLALSSTARGGFDNIAASGAAWAKGEPTHPGGLVGLGKESGDVEYSADSVLVLVPQPGTDDARGSIVRMAVAKLRAGAPSWAALRFDGTRFVDAPEQNIVTAPRGTIPADDAPTTRPLPNIEKPRRKASEDK